jgi:hypothetical protein
MRWNRRRVAMFPFELAPLQSLEDLSFLHALRHMTHALLYSKSSALIMDFKAKDGTDYYRHVVRCAQGLIDDVTWRLHVANARTRLLQGSSPAAPAPAAEKSKAGNDFAGEPKFFDSMGRPLRIEPLLEHHDRRAPGCLLHAR